MCTAFTGITINAFLHPFMEMYASDGRCHMGIPPKVSIPFLAIDIVVDLVLTCIFIYLLRPFVKGTDLRGVSSILSSKQSKCNSAAESEEGTTGNSAVQRSIKILLYRSIIAAFAITVITVGLFCVQVFRLHGRGVSLICATICLLDGKYRASRPVKKAD
jgi:hypothetical protein